MQHVSPLRPAGEPQLMPALHGVHHAFLVSIDLEEGLVEVEVPAIRLRYQAEQLRVMNGIHVGGHVGLLSLKDGELSVALMKWP